jgi:hypothetical protein
MLENFINVQKGAEAETKEITESSRSGDLPRGPEDPGISGVETETHLFEDRTPEEIIKTEEDVDLYNISNFSL